jgi:protein-tyrosine phosphatase
LKKILTHQHNFRDLGGIAARDGRKVKPGLLFRSGDFYSLSADDVDVLTHLKLRTIVDLRAQREILHRPDKAIATVKELIHIDIHDAARDSAERFMESGDAKGLETILIGDYVRMVDGHQADFNRFLHIIATTGHLPLVYHCAAGKDRTGLATVFLLNALGVDISEIWTDYMATNLYLAEFAERVVRKLTANGQNGEILRPLLDVRREYLQAALDRIDEGYNGLDAFVRDVLKADTVQLQNKYLG